ncbi:uncharacterized protein LOC109826765 [Asparagus officinalis]|uniref:uncharacterized protein LOC109826765 n=1 Tax=Asparagus officinalis TaxID=4686 RepID=UPI00098E335F|nr:uncharacterized protein LOC109826765 [Asparagus officinalis]
MDPMMIEVTVTPQISPVATKARPTEGVGTSADVMPIAESTLKEPLSLDPPSSEALIEKASDVAGASTATIPESTLVVPEIRLPSSGELSHAEGSSIELVPSSSLSDRIRALLADEDPDKAGICSDLDGFISFLNSMVDRILSKGSRFESFKKPLDRYISGIRDEGYNDLADSINAYMVDLKQHVDLLRGLRTESVPSYIASRMDSKLQALRDSQTSANLELQQLRAHSDQLRMNVGKRIQAQVNLRRDLESSRAEIARLEEELAMAKDAHDVLKSELTQEIHIEGNLLQQLNLQDKIIAEKEQELLKASLAYSVYKQQEVYPAYHLLKKIGRSNTSTIDICTTHGTLGPQKSAVYKLIQAQHLASYLTGSCRSKGTCYIIDMDTSYNLLLGRPWTHTNRIVQSTLHQVMKYANDEGEVQTLIAEKRPFRGVESFHIDSIFYLESQEKLKEDADSGTETDI